MWLLLITLLLGSIIIFRNTLEDTLLWQKKEYRFDRFLTSLKDKNQKIFRGRINTFFKITLFVLSALYFRYETSFLLIFPLITVVTYVFESFEYLVKIVVKKRIIRPKVSIRNVIIGVLTLIPTLSIFVLTTLSLIKFYGYYGSNPEITSLYSTIVSLSNLVILFDLLVTINILLLVIITSPLAYLKRQITVNKAKQKLQNFPDLKVIGITGSYGKTSTKEILYEILKSKYKVAYTPENLNTTIGIAQSILSEIKEDSEIFIVEMGAYKKGEIKKSTDLIAPDISIITNIGKAHLDIFGSVENIATAKYEIVKGLKENGVAILNSDNQYTHEMLKKTDNQICLFGFDNQFIDNPSIKLVRATSVEWNDKKVKFNIESSFGKRVMRTSLLGEQNLFNLLASITCALQLNFTLEEIQNILKNTNFESSHFKQYEGKNGVLIIDDGYNTNPDGFDSALKHLSNIKKKNKVIITKGIPEIGKEIGYIYDNLAKKIIENAHVLITSDELLSRKIKSQLSKINCILVKETEDFNSAVQKYLNKESVILVEGRVNPETINVLKK